MLDPLRPQFRSLFVAKRESQVRNKVGVNLAVALYSTQFGATSTVRYLGRFFADVAELRTGAVNALARQLDLSNVSRRLVEYQDSRQRLRHTEEICHVYGYREFTTTCAGFRLSRWLYIQCWTGTDRPTVLFDRATSWL